MGFEKSVTLNENHKRSFTSTLLIIERNLIDIKDMMVNPPQTCCSEIKMDVDHSTIEQNLKVIDEALDHVCSLKVKYNTDKSVQSLQRIIDSKKSKIWEVLHNSK